MGKLKIFVIACVLVLGGVESAVAAPKKPKPKVVAKLRYTPEFILEQVLLRKNQTKNSEIPAPKISFGSKTKLAYFQEAMLPQWGSKPAAFTNAYAVLKNEVFLLDEDKYYKKLKRCMDDSLAHELTHYVQAQYQHFDLNDDSLEYDAVDVQTWFRETYCN